MVTVGTRIGTEPDHLLDEPEPCLEDVLSHHRHPVGDGRECDHHRLQVSGETPDTAESTR